MGRTRIIDGLGEVAAGYGLFVIDQWGVLHDGEAALPGAVEAMRRLRELSGQTGAKVALLSNSGKRVAHSHDRLAALGIERGLYDAVVTSGEMVHAGLARRGDPDGPDPFYAGLGRRVLGFFWDADRSLLDGLDLQETDDVETADFVLCAGTSAGELAAYRPVLERALARGLPLVCANPDRVSVQPDGTLKMCPGEVAAAYEAMGGTVRWHGKPRPDVYAEIRRLTGTDGPDAPAGLGIGDSLQHDIAGAEAAGLDSLFVTGGIHRDDLPVPLDAARIAALAAARGVTPTYAAPAVRW